MLCLSKKRGQEEERSGEGQGALIPKEELFQVLELSEVEHGQRWKGKATVGSHGVPGKDVRSLGPLYGVALGQW